MPPHHIPIISYMYNHLKHGQNVLRQIFLYHAIILIYMPSHHTLAIFLHNELLFLKTLNCMINHPEAISLLLLLLVTYLIPSSFYIFKLYLLAITPPTNRAKLEPFDKTNAGNLHKYRFSAFLSVIQTPYRLSYFLCLSRFLLSETASSRLFLFIIFSFQNFRYHSGITNGYQCAHLTLVWKYTRNMILLYTSPKYNLLAFLIRNIITI